MEKKNKSYSSEKDSTKHQICMCDSNSVFSRISVSTGAAETDVQHSQLPVHKLHPRAHRFSPDQHVRAAASRWNTIGPCCLVISSLTALSPQPVAERGCHHAVPRPHGQPVSQQPLGAVPHQVYGELSLQLSSRGREFLKMWPNHKIRLFTAVQDVKLSPSSEDVFPFDYFSSIKAVVPKVRGAPPVRSMKNYKT